MNQLYASMTMQTIAQTSRSIDIRVDTFNSMNDPNITFRLIIESMKKSKHARKSSVQLSLMKDLLRNALALSRVLSILFLPAYAAYATRTTPPADSIAYIMLRSCKEALGLTFYIVQSRNVMYINQIVMSV